MLESEIRHEVKGILHLTPSTSVVFFYTSKNNEGLGLPRFEHLVKLGTIKNALKNERVFRSSGGYFNRSEHRVEAQEDRQLFKDYLAGRPDGLICERRKGQKTTER